MRCSLSSVVLIVLCALAAGAQARAEVRIEQTTYRGWSDAYRLSNGTVEVVVVPAVGRVMRYGFVGGTNVLWENPAVAGKPIALGTWPNVGGDKVWPWPQSEWPQRTGRSWPPPSGADQAAQGAEVVGPGALRLTSPVVSGYGVRVVRDIQLAPAGTQVTISSRLVKVRTGAAFPVAVWSIAQLPIPDVLLARLLPGSSLPDGYRGADPAKKEKPWKSLRAENGVLFAERASGWAAKIFIDADLLVAVKDDLLFTLRSQTAHLPPSAFVPGDRAQIYSHADKSALPPDVPPYIELELTSPLQTLEKGEEVTLRAVWELQRLDKAQQDPAAVGALVRTL